MTKAARLSELSPNPLTRALLASAEGDRPSDDARKNAAIAIGLAGGLGTVATLGSGAATATGSAALSSKWLGVVTALKVVGATVVSSALVVGVAKHEQWSVAGVVPAPSAHHAVAVAGARQATSLTRARRPLPAEALEEAVSVRSTPNDPVTPLAPPVLGGAAAAPLVPPVAPTAPQVLSDVPTIASIRLASPAPARAPLRSPAHEGATLRDEVEWLDRARTTLAAGHGAAARAEVDAYERAFPSGVLRDEAELVQIEASIQARDVGAARAGAARLLARDEHGPLARRLRALLASLPGGEGAR